MISDFHSELTTFIQEHPQYLPSIDRALTHLYAPFSPPQETSLVLFTWVIADGLGDFYAQQEATRVLKQAFPKLKITVVTLAHHSKPLPETSTHYVIRYTGKLNQPIIYEAFSESLQTLLRTADLIVQFPTVFFDLHRYAHPDQISSIGEHSSTLSAHYHPETGGGSMGLRASEKGIFCKQLPIPDPQTIRMLHPELDNDTVLHTHTFNCAYTKTVKGTYLYLLSLIAALKPYSKDCAICFINIPWLKQLLEIKFSHPLSAGVQFLNACGIKEIQILSKRETEVLTFNPTGKTIRIIEASQLSQTQVTSLFSLSDTLIGCTGDQSILEAIATGTPFFYDPPPLKRPFLNDLKALAEDRISSELTQFFNLCLMPNDSEESIATHLAHRLQKAKHDFLKLKTILHAEYDFGPFLINHVKRKLLLRKHPQLKSFEQEQLIACAQGKQSEKITLENIRNCLKNHYGSQ